MIVPLSLQDPDTVEQVWGLQHAAYRLEAYAVGLKHLPPLPDTFETLRDSSESFYGYVTSDGDILGVIAVVVKTDGVIEITRLMVHPQHLRKGIGRAMLEYITQIHSEVGKFIVTAGTLNVPAVSLYQQFGFIPTETLTAMTEVKLTVFHLDRR
ncbi:GNAT family N-acetyltransferase [Paenibacillus fonticola]|uniref:GNAT family N-acetyltransferase n=1 Tax=Paenibacillus fonticola TaxID=379896 RepID=UPI00037C0689|nr:GNAT family N-acetyltransferase [Paenibacillus fonticola]